MYRIKYLKSFPGKPSQLNWSIRSTGRGNVACFRTLSYMSTWFVTVKSHKFKLSTSVSTVSDSFEHRLRSFVSRRKEGLKENLTLTDHSTLLSGTNCFITEVPGYGVVRERLCGHCCAKSVRVTASEINKQTHSLGNYFTRCSCQHYGNSFGEATNSPSDLIIASIWLFAQRLRRRMERQKVTCQTLRSSSMFERWRVEQRTENYSKPEFILGN